MAFSAKLRSWLLLISSLWLLVFSPPAAAQGSTPYPVVELDSIDGATTGSLHNYMPSKPPSPLSQVYIASYHCYVVISGRCAPDGGEGLLVYQTGSTCHAADEDGGSIFYDASHNCWYRTNLNGDLRQWGLTQLSPYDATANKLSAAGASSFIQHNAIPALLAAGITNISTGQVALYFQSVLPLGSPGMSFSCGAAGGNQVPGGVFQALPGTIYLEHGAYFDLQTAGNASVIHNCLLLPSWLLPSPGSLSPPNQQASHDCMPLNGSPAGVNFTYPAVGYSDLEAIRANMIICADTAIKFDTNSGGRSHDLWAFGFDNPFYLSHADHSGLDDTAADGDICYYVDQGGGNTRVSNSICDVTLTKNPSVPGHTNSNCVQWDTTNGEIVCNSEYWQISNITASATTNSYGRHNCRIKLVAGTAVGSWIDQSTMPPTGHPPSPSLISGLSSSAFLQMAPPLSNSNPAATGDPITYPMWISNLTNKNSAMSCLGHGPYAISVVSHNASSVTVDLLESEWGMDDGTNHDQMPATANWDACPRAPCTIRIIAGDVNAMEYQELVYGTDIPGNPLGTTLSPCTHILSVVRNAKGLDPYDGAIAEIVVDQPLVTAHNGSSTTGGDITIYIASNPGTSSQCDSSTLPRAYVASATLCDDALNGNCAFFHTGTRTFAGQSDAGKDSAKLPESNTHYYGAGYLDDGTAGLDLLTAFSFSHHYGYVVQDANSTHMTGRGGDDNGELDDLGEEFHVVNGTANVPTVQGGKGGQSGLGIVNNFYMVSANAANATTTTTGTVNQGTGVTVAMDTTNLLTDLGLNAQNGKGTVGICPPTPTGSLACGNLNANEEYVTYEILTPSSMPGVSGTVLITSRGDYFTAPPGLPGGSGSTVQWPVGAQIFALQLSRPSFCATYASTLAPVTNDGQNSVENIGGCLELVNFYQAQQKNVFIGGNAGPTSISNSDFVGMSFFYENAAAMNAVSGCGNALIPQQPWNCVPVVQSTSAGANVIMDASAEVWPCDATSGPTSLVVPAGSTMPNHKFEVKKIDTTSNICTVIMASGDTIDGASEYLLSSLNQGIAFSNVNGTAAWYTRSLGAPLAHGQVYFSLASHTVVQLCGYNGTGLIVNEQLLSIAPSGTFSNCLTMGSADTMGANMMQYVYAGQANNFAVSGTAAHTGKVQITTSTLPFAAGDLILASCHGIVGTTEANITDRASIDSSTQFTLLDATYVNAWVSGGSCDLLGLTAGPAMPGHTTASNGVEVKNGDATKTLVGMVYTDGSQHFNDLATERDVASWFNRRIKTCRNTWASAATVSSTSYKELTATAGALHCEFVSWAQDNLQWSLFGTMINSAASASTATLAGDFDGSGTSGTPETENVQWPGGASAIQFPLSLTGSASLSEAWHYLTTFGMSTAGTITISGASSGVTGGEEVRIPQ